MQAELHAGVLVGVLKRILFVAGCAIGSAFVATLLAPSSGTAHAASGTGSVEIEPETTTPSTAASAMTTSGGDESEAAVVVGSDDAPSLWADPANVSASAVRRASGEPARSAATQVRTAPSPESTPATGRTTPRTPTGHPAASIIAPVATAAGPLAPAGGNSSPDAGPSTAQLAFLMAALGVVLWLSQRFLASELAWRSVFINSIAERPG